MPDSPRVFISYAHADYTDFVNRLEQDLKAQQFDPWIDRSLEGGEAWVEAIQLAIDECQALVVVLSPAAVESEYVHMEYHYAKEEGKRVIPVMWHAVRIPIDLRLTQCIDFQRGYEEGLRQLVKALNRGKSPTTPSAASPDTPTSPVVPLPLAPQQAVTRKLGRLRNSILLAAALVILLGAGIGLGIRFLPSPNHSTTHNPTTTPTYTPTTTAICGIDTSSAFQPNPITLSDSDMAGLLIDNSTAQQDFDNQVETVFANYADRTAGIVQVFGGGSDPAVGQNLAQHAITALKLLGNQQPPFIFESQYAVFQNLWDGSIGSNQVGIYTNFYSSSCNSTTSNPTTVSTPTAHPNCGVDPSSGYISPIITLSDSDMTGLLIDNTTAQQDFYNQIKVVFASYASLTAGIVQVYGSGNNDQSGENLALHAITALTKLGDQQPPFIFEKEYATFQKHWSGNSANNQVSLDVFFYPASCHLDK